MIVIKAARRLITAANVDSVVLDLKRVGFKDISKGRGGVFEMSPMEDSYVKTRCSKLLKDGYQKQGTGKYPDKNGVYHLRSEYGATVSIDPDGSIKIQVD